MSHVMFLVGVVLAGQVLVAQAEGKRPRTIGNAPPLTAQPVGEQKPRTPTASCEVFEVRAEETGKKQIDPKLARFTRELGEPPMKSFDTFTVVGSETIALEAGSSKTVKITASLTVMFKGTTRQNDKDRQQFEITVDDSRGKRVFRMNVTQDPGASQFYSAGKVDKSTLFFAVTCSAK
jgi:hypothetical protein